MSFDLYERETGERLATMKPVQIQDVTPPSMFETIDWEVVKIVAVIVGLVAAFLLDRWIRRRRK